MKSFVSLASMLAISSLAAGQTYTSCNPTTNTTCPSDTALGRTLTIDFTNGESSQFTPAEGTTIFYGTEGASFVIDSSGTAKTITSNWYIFFGKVEIILKAANGTGIVSSFVLESDDLDEIDWEWLGGNTTVVETNYFGKGNTTTYDRATYEAVNDPQDTWHTYTIDWTSEYVKWYVDGVLVRTLLYADALDGKNFPQTPMRIKMGNWVGGAADAAKGTVEWAGGYTDLSEAPFIMYVKSITVEDYTTSGTKYTYGDESGSYKSIVISGNTTSQTSYANNSSVGTSTSSNETTAASTTVAVITSSASPSTSSVPATSSSAKSSAAKMVGSFGVALFGVGFACVI